AAHPDVVEEAAEEKEACDEQEDDPDGRPEPELRLLRDRPSLGPLAPGILARLRRRHAPLLLAIRPANRPIRRRLVTRVARRYWICSSCSRVFWSAAGNSCSSSSEGRTHLWVCTRM